MAEDRERPIREGGERLRQPTIWGGGGGPENLRGDPAAEAIRLRRHVAALRTEARAIDPRLRGKRVVFRATMHAEFLAGTHFPLPLIQATGIEVVGSAPARSAKSVSVPGDQPLNQAPARLLFMAATDEELERLESVLQGPQNTPAKAWLDVRKFAELRLSREDEVLRTDTEPDPGSARGWEAVLHPPTMRWTTDEADANLEEIYAKFVDWVRSLAGAESVRGRRRYIANGMCYLPVHLTPEQAREAARFNALRVIRPLPSMAVPGRPTGTLFPPGAPPSAYTRPTVTIAMFDGGLDPKCTSAARYTTPYKLTDEDPVDEWVTHGTVVNNAVLYGSAAESGQLPEPAAHVDHYRVLPRSSESADYNLLDVVESIDDVLRTRDYAIAHLSYGPEIPVHPDDPPHEWTVRLDRVALERKVTVVSAVGNLGREDETRGGNRICVPADMANGIAVGACTGADGDAVRSADYSGRGPGRHGGWVRPHGVGPGGCLALGKPFVGLAAHGQVEDEGTSYAAALVTHTLAGLVGVLGRRRSRPETLRAFAVHFCRRGPGSHGVLKIGYGRFELDLRTVLDCSENEVTVLYEDSVSRGEAIALRLPVPSGLDPKTEIAVRFTLCYTSPVDPSDVAGYTQAGFEWRVTPHARRYALLDEETREELDVFDAWEEAIVPSEVNGRPVRLARRPKRQGFGTQPGTERRLRAEGKWDTTISKYFRAKAEDLHEPVLELRHLFRSRGRLIPRDKRPNLRYTLLVTVRTPEGVPLYPLAEAQFQLPALQTDIAIAV
ncbi:S8 family serine peptidase [Longimicrobium sp.]|jgi:hypothetical protein|uniref:S8 family serine peptidase n=1 Tax=Longimicrobium sp. TaxID=2029185 RepID=UPI002EDABC03